MRKKKKVVIIYRKSSPRTGRPYDTMTVFKDKLDYYLSRGWSDSIEEFALKAEIKEIEKQIENITIPPSELSAETKAEIFNAKGTHREISEKFNVSTYTVHRIKTGRLA